MNNISDANRELPPRGGVAILKSPRLFRKVNMKNIIRLFVVVVITVAAIYYFRWYQQWQSAQRERQPHRMEINCVNNLKQVGLGFRIWAGDHGDRLPFNVSTNEGGTLEITRPGPDGYFTNSCLFLKCMSNELTRPVVLVCPEDTAKWPATDWGSLNESNVSYRFYGGTNKILAVCPIDGNILYADGSVASKHPEQADDSGQMPLTLHTNRP